MICNVLTTVFFALAAFFAFDISANASLVTALAICAKTTCNVGWFVNYAQTMELLPTSCRVTGVHIASSFSIVINISAPYLILLGSNNLPLVYGVFAGLGVLGSIASAFLPESFKQEFPNSIEDIESRPEFPFWSWRVWKESKASKGGNEMTTVSKLDSSVAE